MTMAVARGVKWKHEALSQVVAYMAVLKEKRKSIQGDGEEQVSEKVFASIPEAVGHHRPMLCHSY